MKKRLVVKLPVLAALVFCTVFQAQVSSGQVPPASSDTFSVGVYYVDFATPQKVLDKTTPLVVAYPPDTLVDTTLYITNPGVSGTNLCANIYVFSPDAQMISCCSCLVDQNGLLTLSAADDLTNIRWMRFIPRKGVFKIVSSAPPCDAANPTPAPQLLVYGGIRYQGGRTWTAVPGVTLGSAELSKLKNQCGMLYYYGHGMCSCGQ